MKRDRGVVALFVLSSVCACGKACETDDASAPGSFEERILVVLKAEPLQRSMRQLGIQRGDGGQRARSDLVEATVAEMTKVLAEHEQKRIVFEYNIFRKGRRFRFSAAYDVASLEKAIQAIVRQGPKTYHEFMGHLAKKDVSGLLPNLVSATRSLDVDTVRRLLEEGDDPNQADEEGHSLVSIAILELDTGQNDQRQDAVLALLLEKGARTDKRDPNGLGLSPLHMAVIKENASAVKILLEHGAQFFAEDAKGITPKRVASFLKKKAIADLLERAASAPRPLPCPPRPLAGPVTLRPKFPKGLERITEYVSYTQIELDGRVVTNERQERTERTRVIEVSPDAEKYDLEMTLIAVRLFSSIGAFKPVFDSSYMKRPESVRGHNALAMLDTPVLQTVNSRGQVVDYNHDTLRKKEIGRSEEQWATLESELEQRVEGLLGGVPERELKQGDSWHGNIGLYTAGLGNEKGAATYTVLGLCDEGPSEFLVIGVSVGVAHEVDEESSVAAEITRTGDLRGGGWVGFSLQKGFQIAADTHYRYTGKLGSKKKKSTATAVFGSSLMTKEVLGSPGQSGGR